MKNKMTAAGKALLIAILVLTGACSGDRQWRGKVAEKISAGLADRARLEVSPLVTSFYQQRKFQPAWFNGPRKSTLAASLLGRIARSDEEGLNPERYHFSALQNLERQKKVTIDRVATEELLLSDAFLAYSSDLALGVTNPTSLNPTWVPDRKRADFTKVLEKALAEHRVDKTLDALSPGTWEYRALRNGLKKYRQLVTLGGLPKVPTGRVLKLGDMEPRVAFLRRRLLATGELTGSATSLVYEPAVAEAVALFQSQHSLPASGSLDLATTQALNVSAEARVDELEIALERYRWLPRSLGERYVFVDIARFTLSLIEKGKTTLSMPVVVGKTTDPTPVFDDRIEYLVLNPTWTLPKNLVMDELVPHLRSDPNYLQKKGMTLSEIVGGERREIASNSVDWKAVDRNHWRYVVSQKPGAQNPLGKMKFIFPNRFEVYLHGTPNASTFSRNVRSESHGCIRLQRPQELALALLRDSVRKNGEHWTEAALNAVLKDGNEQTVRLKPPVPVHLFYWTVRADEQGQLQFQPDVYHWNPLVKEALSFKQKRSPLAR